MFQALSMRRIIVSFISIVMVTVFAVLAGIHISRDAHADTTSTFSGVMTDSTGRPLVANLSLVNSSGVKVHSAMSTSDGSFSIAAEPGVYSLSLTGGRTGGTFGSEAEMGYLYGFTLSQPVNNPTIDLTGGSATQNLVLPVSSVNYTGYNPQGYPANVTYGRISVKSTTLANPVSLYSGDPGWNTISVDSVTARVVGPSKSKFTSITGVTYQPGKFCFYSSTSTGWGACNANAYTVTSSPTELEYPNTPPAKKSFSGTFKGDDGTPIGGQITLTDAYANSVKSTISGTDGSFEVQVRPGTYRISEIYGYVDGSTSPKMANFFLMQSGAPTINLSTDNVNQNLTVPLATVNFYNNAYAPGTVKFTGTSTTTYQLYSGDPGTTMSSLTASLFQTAKGGGSFRVVEGTSFAPGSMCVIHSPGTWLKDCAVNGLNVVSGTYYVYLVNIPAVRLTVQTPAVAPSLQWTAVTHTTKYLIYRDNVKIAETTGLSFVDNNVSVGSHVYSVVASDDTGNVGNASSNSTKTVNVIAPSAPAAPEATISLAWGTVQGAVSYNVYRDDVLIGNTNALRYVDESPLSTNYSYQVSALNGHGDEGVLSSAVLISKISE